MLDKVKERERFRRFRQRTRDEVITLLGAACRHCGIDDKRVLDIDHVVPPTKKTIYDKSTHLYRSILKGHKPLSDFQLLCCNCHRIKTLENHDHIPRHKQGEVTPQGEAVHVR